MWFHHSSRFLSPLHDPLRCARPLHIALAGMVVDSLRDPRFPHSRPPAVTKVTFGKAYRVEVSRPPAVTKVTFGETYRVGVCVPASPSSHSIHQLDFAF
jgi:hypothetical protein